MFGIKGGAAGGGMTQVVPMEDLNLHFTGDIHAIGAANNLLAAMLDASILHGNPLHIDALRVGWRRAMDMNDRALRQITVALGGRANGYPRESGFDITAASEVMAIMAVSRDLQDLRRRLGAITVAHSFNGGAPITAEDLGAAGAMAVLLKDALKPNLIQTLEGQPCLMHCGPFANIAHGNNSLVADLIGMKLGDYVVTESGFGSDMGAEKFFDIVCRFGGLAPERRRARHHRARDQAPRRDRRRPAHRPRPRARRDRGRHGQRPPPPGQRQAVRRCRAWSRSTAAPATPTRRSSWSSAWRWRPARSAAEANEGFAKGGIGAADLASAVVDACDEPSEFRMLYEDDWTIQDKIEAIARRVYGAADVYFYPEAEKKIGQYSADGLDQFPICMAKTHLSLSSDPELLNAPENFSLPVRDIRAYTGAGWLVPLCGDITQMPGLGKTPAALNVDIDENGRTVGLF